MPAVPGRGRGTTLEPRRRPHVDKELTGAGSPRQAAPHDIARFDGDLALALRGGPAKAGNWWGTGREARPECAWPGLNWTPSVRLSEVECGLAVDSENPPDT